MKDIWKLLLTINIIATLRFNLKVFPLKTAVKLPVWLFGKTKFVHLHKGCVKINCPIRYGVLRIGGGINTLFIPYYNSENNYLNIRGTMEIGGLTMIGGGALIAVADGATLKLGKGCYLSNRTKIFCEKDITIGDNVRFSWECQIFDSNFHYTSSKGVIKPKEGAVFIGDNCWICNRVTIQKNTHLPSCSVVASNSLVNKDFSSCDEKCLYAGVPAKQQSENIHRIHGQIDEQIIYMMFQSGKDEIAEVDYIEQKRSTQNGYESLITPIWGKK